MRKVYQVRCEKNDNGFDGGYYLYGKVTDARQSMRDHIARQIRCARDNGKKVIKVFHFASNVMEEPNAKCEEIFRNGQVRYGFYILSFRQSFFLSSFWERKND